MTRKFTIIDTETQKTKVIESEAVSVAELKRDLRSEGFNVEGKTIQEGLTRIEFKSDDAILPHDVPRNGGVTNDLVFRLTKTNKQIKSGAMARPEAYATIKKLGIADSIKAKYGKNFTQCSTADLISAIEAAKPKAKKEGTTKTKEASVEKPTPKVAAPEAKTSSNVVVQAIAALTGILMENSTITKSDGEKITDILGVSLPAPKGSCYSKSELDNMFAGM